MVTAGGWQSSDRIGRRIPGTLPASILDQQRNAIAAFDAFPPRFSVTSFPSQDRHTVCTWKNETGSWDCPFESAPHDVEQDRDGVVPLGFVPGGILLSHRAASQDPPRVHDNMEQAGYKMFRSLIRKHDAPPNSLQESHHRTSALDLLLGHDRHSLLSFLQHSRSTPLGAFFAMRWLISQTPLQHDDVIQRIHEFLGGGRYSRASTFATCGTRAVAMSTGRAPPLAVFPSFTVERDDATSHISTSFSSFGI